jgi:hypothetical protein
MSYFSEFYNILYLYPKSVNISSKYSNIFIKIFVKSNEKQVENRIKNNNNQQFEYFYVTSIMNDQTKPQFFDEIKILLPITLSVDYHLYFEFYNLKNIIKETKFVSESDWSGKANIEKIGVSFQKLVNKTYNFNKKFNNLKIYKRY